MLPKFRRAADARKQRAKHKRSGRRLACAIAAVRSRAALTRNGANLVATCGWAKIFGGAGERRWRLDRLGAGPMTFAVLLRSLAERVVAAAPPPWGRLDGDPSVLRLLKTIRRNLTHGQSIRYSLELARFPAGVTALVASRLQGQRCRYGAAGRRRFSAPRAGHDEIRIPHAAFGTAQQSPRKFKLCNKMSVRRLLTRAQAVACLLAKESCACRWFRLQP